MSHSAKSFHVLAPVVTVRRNDEELKIKLFAFGVARAKSEGGCLRMLHMADRADFSITAASGEKYALKNLYALYASAPKSKRPALLGRWCAALVESRSGIPATLTAAAEVVMPMIRARGERNHFRVHSPSVNVDFVTVPFTEDFELAVVIDRPTSLARLTRDWLPTCGASLADVVRTAKQNLGLNSREAFAEIADGVYESVWQDAFDASRIALPEILELAPVDGRHVAMIPDRDHLLVTGDLNASGLSIMVERGLAYYDVRPYKLSAQPLVLNAGRWEPLTLPPPLAADVRRRAVAAKKADYDVQGEMLKRENESTAFVASYLVGDSGSGDVFSVVTWTREPVSLLPKAEYILFVSENAMVIRVVWDVAIEIMGRLEALPGLWPERFIVDRFPTEEELLLLSGIES
jgi:hypothetical protein